MKVNIDKLSLSVSGRHVYAPNPTLDGPLVRPATPPETRPIWARALDAHLEATTTIARVVNMGHHAQENGFMVDHILLSRSRPFAWSAETVRAVLQASESVPPETEFNVWNLDTPAVWWWFEEALPFQTLNLKESLDAERLGVRALSFGWLMQNGVRGLGCSAWCDTVSDERDNVLKGLTITPTQTWLWDERNTLGEMLKVSRQAYDQQYGPGGRFQSVAYTLGVEKFILACDGLSRFVLAGLAWLNQRILVEEKHRPQRQRRKEFVRRTGRELPDVRVVNLRKAERAEHEPSEEPSNRAYTCRWVVGGHWRNQACGPQHSEHRLTYVHPYVKGPDEAPLKGARAIVYKVDR